MTSWSASLLQVFPPKVSSPRTSQKGFVICWCYDIFQADWAKNNPYRLLRIFQPFAFVYNWSLLWLVNAISFCLLICQKINPCRFSEVSRHSPLVCHWSVLWLVIAKTLTLLIDQKINRCFLLRISPPLACTSHWSVLWLVNAVPFCLYLIFTCMVVYPNLRNRCFFLQAIEPW